MRRAHNENFFKLFQRVVCVLKLPVGQQLLNNLEATAVVSCTVLQQKAQAVLSDQKGAYPKLLSRFRRTLEDPLKVLACLFFQHTA